MGNFNIQLRDPPDEWVFNVPLEQVYPVVRVVARLA